MDRAVKSGEDARPLWSVTIRKSRCKECAFCVSYCPQGVLALQGNSPAPVNPEECTGCMLCAWICPDFAIEVTRREGVEEPTQDRQ
jgi:NAD-dependent dihydropyrimidine dehydrogenase PreA subunit